MSLIIIACGGTGGHLSPGIALAEALHARGHETLLIISRKSIDTRLLEKYPHLKFQRAPGTGLQSKSPLALLRFITSQTHALLHATRLVHQRHPALLVSFGGFLTLGLALVCHLAHIPIVLHEANRIPGKAIRYLSRIATRTWLPHGISLPSLPPEKQRHASFPIRKEFRAHPRDNARRELGFPPETGKLLLVLGGSQGAGPLNEWVFQNKEKINATGAHVLCVTGPGKSTAPPPSKAATDMIGTNPQTRFIPFCDKMPEALSAADLVLSRAGAGSIAEFITCTTPSILVPYPFAADNHQQANAQFLEKLQGGKIIPQEQLKNATEEILHLLNDATALNHYRENLRRARKNFSWHPMLDDITHLAAQKMGGRKTSHLRA
ncbi:MAG: UDP-N-acetylglucosamine--N-acetylmuramyl-(pentapeptide) pyrophosphoryl-undecaprenol N-acetylglucosamine transferase [Puniceicoccales bacterium]|jgi:UDP-N-acetylglucosamine--N-acetylmuramyl-(pentapeptide) pyrophosphoryl-undecaprenol N-acetylglucosamine transferase|nr:UDP-N-acetylglucosamine--N-acetylmuramyl-(pentapeptide) pyrophosphoryl-undecaprenol N-acetylglucosamine transferase [Puniceicoccales bacterium]